MRGEESNTEVNRRTFMRAAGKTGVAAGALIWAAPLVQTTVPAWAAVGSHAPEPGPDPHSDPHSDPHTAGGTGGDGPGTTSGDTTVLAVDDASTKDGSAGGGVGALAASDAFDLAGGGELARAGTDPWNLVKLAGGAIAVGGAARAVGRRLEQQDDEANLGYDGGVVGA